jgi:hypothetical protein
MKGIYSFMAKGRHSVTLSYTRTPHVVVTGRLNGIPLSSSFQREGEKLYCFEMASPTGETPEGYIATIPHALVRNQKNPEDSAIGDLVYTAISRDESRELAQENPDFGVLELQVVRGYELSNLQVEFKQVEAPVEFRFPDAGETMTRSFGTKSYGGGGYTAGVTALQNVRKATITAKPFEIERVLLRDALCLVHKERGPAETYGTAHVAEMGPAN